ncbi:hypothetical protein BN341_19510 [Helicobacter heilmannii ASB1.4]|uniref:Uncharacterized protein n=1 Tax=Helicobacter heilmannii TaxID=35817 RepID=A0A0K2Y4Q5_HELHE|nr:hypothetical protein BN341_19510 [Helicobacter heilmannii ASB1.4]CRI33788.1 hypothetical protein HHE01_14740 [Helicobacter heilmannii]
MLNIDSILECKNTKHWVYDSHSQNIRVLCELSNDVEVKGLLKV